MKYIASMFTFVALSVALSCSSADTTTAQMTIQLQTPRTKAVQTALAPTGITGFTILISAPDIKEIKKNYPGNTTSASLRIPAGEQRTITVIARTPEAEYRGSSTGDFEAGKLYTITITMAFNRSLTAEAILNFTYPAGSPQGITGYSVTIRGSGMTDQLNSYPEGTESVTVTFPAGTARTISVTALTPVGNFSGSVTRDFAIGETAELTIPLLPQSGTTTPVTLAFSFPTALPPELGSTFSLLISGTGFIPIATTYTPGSTIAVPTGAARTFVVEMPTPGGSAGPVLSWLATATVDLVSAEAVTVPLEAFIGRTKIIIPDANNNRAVQINEMSGAGWTEFNYQNAGYGVNDAWRFVPDDMSYDAQGRIYLLSTLGDNTTDPKIFRMDDFTGTNLISFAKEIYDLRAISIDHDSGIVYAADYYGRIWQMNPDGTNLVEIPLYAPATENPYFMTIYGMDIDSLNNLLYIAGSAYNELTGIFKVDLKSVSVTGSFTGSASLLYPRGVLVRDDGIFVLEQSDIAAPQYAMVQLATANLAFVGAFGSAYTATMDPGIFLGPYHFLTDMTSRFIITDGGLTSDYFENRIVSYEDTAWDVWTTFRGADIGKTDFLFYNNW